jgi:hypothetical protein
VTVPAKPVILNDAFFAEALCRNCGTALTGAHCAHCGQKKAGRIGAGSVRTEIWEKLRLFELDQLQSALRLVTGPGKVARDYVYGVRKRHTHPLKLLLLAIAVLLVVLAQTRYLNSANVQVTKVMETVRKYAEWSFSLGLAAIWLASMTGFRKRLGYNAVEHLVLALYTHFVIIHALRDHPREHREPAAAARAALADLARRAQVLVRLVHGSRRTRDRGRRVRAVLRRRPAPAVVATRPRRRRVRRGEEAARLCLRVAAREVRDRAGCGRLAHARCPDGTGPAAEGRAGRSVARQESGAAWGFDPKSDDARDQIVIRRQT